MHLRLCAGLALVALLAVAAHLGVGWSLLQGPEGWSAAPSPRVSPIWLCAPYLLCAGTCGIRFPRMLRTHALLWASGIAVVVFAAAHGLALRAAAAPPAGSRRLIYEWLLTHLDTGPWLWLHLASGVALSVHVALGLPELVRALLGKSQALIHYAAASLSLLLLVAQCHWVAHFASGRGLWSLAVAVEGARIAAHGPGASQADPTSRDVP